MTIINPLPYTLTNGTTADATQVMADFNQIVANANSNAAHNGANSDITSLSGLSTPLSVAQGGTGSGTAGGALTNLAAAGTGIANTFTAGPQVLSGAALNEASATLASAATVNIGAAAANYVLISGTTTITAFDTVQSGTRRILEFQGALTLTQNATSLILPGGTSITTAAGDVAVFVSEGSGNWRCASYMVAAALPGKTPTRTVLTTGSAQTYSKKAGCTRINVRMVGGGGGGGGCATSGATNGGTGGNTTFGALTASGGAGSTQSTALAASGGAASGGDINLTGSGGDNAALGTNGLGGCGAPGIYGMGAGLGGGANSNGTAGQPNTGSGGGGGGGNGGTQAPGGGGGGWYCEKLIASPSATYTYTVGAGGTAGGAGVGTSGGAGGSGVIIVDEYYD